MAVAPSRCSCTWLCGLAKRSPAKRSSILPQVRVDEEELAAVRWLHQHMCGKDGRRYTASDVIRMAIARMYDAEGGPADPAATEQAGKPCPGAADLVTDGR